MNVSFTLVVSENIVRRSKVPPDQAPACHLAIAAPALCNNPFITSRISSSGKVGTFGVACSKTTKELYPKRLALIDIADGDIQGHRNEPLQAVKQGDLLRNRSWYRSPEFSAGKSIYYEAGLDRKHQSSKKLNGRRSFFKTKNNAKPKLDQ